MSLSRVTAKEDLEEEEEGKEEEDIEQARKRR